MLTKRQHQKMIYEQRLKDRMKFPPLIMYKEFPSLKYHTMFVQADSKITSKMFGPDIIKGIRLHNEITCGKLNHEMTREDYNISNIISLAYVRKIFEIIGNENLKEMFFQCVPQISSLIGATAIRLLKMDKVDISAYQIRHHPATFNGKVLRFSEHAIMRLFERFGAQNCMISALREYLSVLMKQGGLEVVSPTMLRTWTNRNMYKQSGICRHVLQKYNIDLSAKEYEYVSGYLCVKEGDDHYMVTTFLEPGYRGTPEYSLFNYDVGSLFAEIFQPSGDYDMFDLMHQKSRIFREMSDETKQYKEEMSNMQDLDRYMAVSLGEGNYQRQ